MTTFSEHFINVFAYLFFLFFQEARHNYEKTIKLVGCIFLSLDGTKSKKAQVILLSATDITTGDKLHFLITSCILITFNNHEKNNLARYFFLMVFHSPAHIECNFNKLV